MKVKDGENSHVEEKDENFTMSQWLWGGSFGDKGTVLVFRSCVLATKLNGSQSSSNFNKSNTNGYHSENSYPSLLEPFGSPVSEWDSDDLNSDMSEVEHKSKKDNVVYNELNRISIKNQLPFNNVPSLHKTHKISLKPVKEKLSSFTKSSSVGSSMNQIVYDSGPRSLNTDVDVTPKAINENNVVVPSRNKMPAAILNITYKTAMTETKLLNRLLQAHGLTDVDPQSKHFNLLWSGLHPKPDVLCSLTSYQRVNHFPRSYELTRKDKLFKNIEKMQYFRGPKNFDFIPTTFITPLEYKELCRAHYRTKGPWIVKPAASSRGRGIYIVNTPDQIPKGESVVVAKYIDKPLLVDGHKCDLRLYVCVTSFDPLLIYMYEEGLVRFATVKYDKSNKSLWNPCMHLCNYSINKYHSDYVKSDDPSVENVGHKWTLSAFLRHLRNQGYDTATLMTAIEDVVIKSILSCTQSIASATRMFVSHFSNCFELYGFDILIDEAMKPWLLEINLSPSLGCDTPLDVRLKAALLADTLNLVGIPAVDPVIKNEPSISGKQTLNFKMKMKTRRRVHSAENMVSKKKGFSINMTGSMNESDFSILTNDEIRIIRHVKAQYQRRGGYVRIFPSQDSWRKYAQYLDPVTGIPVSNVSVKSTSLNSLTPHNYNLLVHMHVLPNFDPMVMSQSSSTKLPERLKRYERVLPTCARVSLDSSAGSNTDERTPNKTATRSTVLDNKNTKIHIKQQILHGNIVPLSESRRVFSTFLMCVLKRISNSTSELSVQHADLILRFLKKVSHTSKMPYNIKSPSKKMNDKDKAAVIAKQLNDFLDVYHKETDMVIDSDHKKTNHNSNFNQFISSANETDLEEILLTILKKEGYFAPFLGDRLSPMCIDIPPTQQPGFETPLRHQLLKYLVYVTPVHSRRYKLNGGNYPSHLPLLQK